MPGSKSDRRGYQATRRCLRRRRREHSCRQAPLPATAHSRRPHNGTALPAVRRTVDRRPSPDGQQCHLGVSEHRRRQHPVDHQRDRRHRGRRWPASPGFQPPPNRGAHQRSEENLLRTTPRSPASKPDPVPNWVGPALSSFPRANQVEPSMLRSTGSGTTTARSRSARRAPATALAPARSVAPPSDNAVATLFERADAAPANRRSGRRTQGRSPSVRQIWVRPADVVRRGPDPRVMKFRVRQLRTNSSLPRRNPGPAHSARIRGTERMRMRRQRGPPLPDASPLDHSETVSDREDVSSSATTQCGLALAGRAFCPRSSTGLRTPGSVSCGSG